MALTQVKTDGIANGAVTTQQLAPGAAGGPKITQIQITDSGGTVLDDTAIGLSGGYIKITGTGFAAGAQVIVNNTPATSTTFTSTTVLNAQVGAQSAGTYVVYVVNTDGGVAIAVNGLTYSDTPTWVTGSTLDNQITDVPISIQLSATGANTYSLAAGNTLPSGLSLSSGGLLSGTVSVLAETTYSFTIDAIDTELQDSPRTFSLTVNVVISDPYFYLTTLLLPGNGTNNGTNNTFLDSSTNALTITRNGNTTQGTFTPFSQTGWSNYFDGTGDYLTIPNNSAFNFGSGDFTIECWVYPTTVSVAEQAIVALYGYTNNRRSWYLRMFNAELRIVWDGDGSTPINEFTSTTSPFVANQWHHVAYVRSGNTFSGYVNGISVVSTTATTTLYNNTVDPVSIGAVGPTYTGFFNGHISNLRVLKGTALYTSTFTPPTSPLTAIANTSLLTCQSNRFLDNSTNNFTITRNGDVSVQAFSPFAPAASYSAGTVGGSSYYDGTADYLTIADNAGLDIGLSSTPFTLEFWVWFNNLSSSQTTYARGGGTGGWDGTSGWQWTNFYYSPDGSFYNQFWNGSSRTDFAFNFNSAGGKPMQWNHIAYSYNGSNYSCFVNGTRAATITASFGKPSSSNKTSIGAATGVVSGETNVLNGYISGFRIVKGTAVYNPTLSTLTVPTAPPTAVANTSLLLNFTNGQILDSTSKNLLETVGDAKISTAQSKWGGSSMYFDGTGDYLTIPASQNFAFGTGDFTIEGWFYASALGGVNAQGIFQQGTSLFPTSLTNTLAAGINPNGTLQIYAKNANTNSVATFSTGTWVHFALVRSGTTTVLYANGTAVITVTSDSTNYTGTFFGVGSIYGTSGTNWNGYINDLRVTKGYARYTTNFTPPTSAFPTL